MRLELIFFTKCFALNRSFKYDRLIAGNQLDVKISNQETLADKDGSIWSSRVSCEEKLILSSE